MKYILALGLLLQFAMASFAQTQDELFSELNNLYRQRQLNAAVPVAEKLIALTSKKGEGHSDHLESLKSLAVLYIELKEYVKAESVCARLAAIKFRQAYLLAQGRQKKT